MIAGGYGVFLALSLVWTNVGMAQSRETPEDPVSGVTTTAVSASADAQSVPPGETAKAPTPSESPAAESEGQKPRRDPFWPVGFVPVSSERTPARVVSVPGIPVAGATEPETIRQPEWEQARQHLNLRGLSSAGRDKITGKPHYVAVMAGRIAEEGDIVSVVYEGRVYRWKVVAIGANGVSLVKLDVRTE